MHAGTMVLDATGNGANKIKKKIKRWGNASDASIIILLTARLHARPLRLRSVRSAQGPR